MRAAVQPSLAVPRRVAQPVLGGKQPVVKPAPQGDQLRSTARRRQPALRLRSIPTGVTFTVGTGRMRVQVCKEDIFRVQYTSTSTLPTKTSLSVSATWGTVPFCVTEAAGTVTITTARMKTKVVESTGVVSYTDLSDTALVAESSKSTTATTVQGTSTYKITTAFTSTSDEALFGLGQQPSSTSNRKNSTLHLANSNGNIFIPMLVSNKGYGLFWDNPSAGDFSSTGTTTSYTSAAGEMVDYYFFYGPTIDQVIAGYRTTTGPAPLFPKWAYGLFQSKDHYGSQTEVLNVVSGYRNAKIPVDVVVQDWDYWDPYSWGSHIMDPSRYANPATMVSTMHTNNVHGMISIWPEYQQMSNPPAAVDGENDQDNFNALNAMTSPTKALYSSGGTHHFYDTFNAAARTLVYQQIYDRLIGKYGWDAIWADNTEPQAYPDSVDVNSQDTALGKGALFINAYPLQHSKALYEGWRKVGPSTKRVYILTRSAWAGIQRYSASEWSGDINADLGVSSSTRFLLVSSYGLSGHALLDHRHWRLLRHAHGGDVHPLVPVRGFLQRFPHPWPSPQGTVWEPVERHRQGEHACGRPTALSLDALHLLAGVEDDQRGLHHHATPGFRLSEGHQGLRHC